MLVVLTLVSAWLRSVTITSQFWGLSPPSTFYYFGPGVALAALEVRYGAALGRGRAPRLASVLGVAAVAIAVTLAVIAPSQDDHRLTTFPGAVAVTFGAACAFGALLVLQLARGACPRLLSNRVARWLGARSYPAYIIQSAVIAEALRLNIGHPGGPRRTLVEMVAFALPITLAAAAVVHARIERPILTWAHRKRGPQPARAEIDRTAAGESGAGGRTRGTSQAEVRVAAGGRAGVPEPSRAQWRPVGRPRGESGGAAAEPQAGRPRARRARRAHRGPAGESGGGGDPRRDLAVVPDPAGES